MPTVPSRRRAASLAATVLAAAAFAATGARPAAAQTTVLYDAANGGVPAGQGNFIFGAFNPNPLTPGNATETFDAPNQYTAVATSAANSIYAGYSNYNVALAGLPTGFTTTTPVNPAFPTLDRAAGFTVSFAVQVSGGVSANAARAPFSLLVVTDADSVADRLGVEIGFLPEASGQNAAIFSQTSGFTRAEVNSGATVAGLLGAVTGYDLRVQGDAYTLSTGGTTLLNGSLKNYTGAAGFGTDVYRTRNFLFLGDNTTSTGGVYRLRQVSVTTSAAPEPTTLALLGGMGAVTLVARRRRRS